MADSTADRVAYAYAVESTIGTSPGGAFQTFLPESDSLALHPTSRPSTTLRSDFQVQENVRLNIDPNGEMPFNPSFVVMDDFWRGILTSPAFNSDALISITASATVTTNVFTASAATPFSVFKVGQWIKTSGFTNPANNGFCKITAIGGGGANITISGLTLVTESLTAGRKFNGAFMQNGTTITTYSWEKCFLDTALPNYDSWLGMYLNSMKLNMHAGDVIKGSFGFQGLTGAITQAAAQVSSGQANYVAAPSNPEWNSNDNILTVYQGTSAIAYDVMEMNITFNRALRAQGKLGKLGPFGRGMGRLTIDIELSVYFKDRVLLDIARASGGSNNVGLAIQFTDSNNAGYILDVPQCSLFEGDPVVTGLDTDNISKFKAMAEIDTLSGKMCNLSKFLSTD